MNSLKDLIKNAEAECVADRASFCEGLKRSEETRMAREKGGQKAGLVETAQIRSLEKQDRLLAAMVEGITNISKEILSAIRLLKTRKNNINTLLNQLTSMLQTKVLVKDIDKQDGKGSIDALKKYVIELHYSLENVPTKYFGEELRQYAAFKLRLEPILRERLESALVGKRLGEVNSITTLMGILEIKFDVVKKYEDLLSSNIHGKLEEILVGLEKKAKIFVNIQNCLSTEAYSLNKEVEDSSYPEIFFQAIVDALTLKYENLASLKESSFVLESPETFRKFLGIMFNESLSKFLKEVRSKMDKFFGFDFMAYIARKDEIAIVIERDDKTPNRFSKMTDEITVMEYYLTEIMNIASQFKLFSEEIAREVSNLIQSSDKQNKFDANKWRLAEVKRLLQSFSFNAEVMEMMACFKVVQERILKARLAIIFSQSKALRVLFHGDAKAIENLVNPGEGDDSKSESNSSRDGVSIHDYLDELFYCLKNSLLRSIKSLDKIAACSCLTFISGILLGNDLYRLTKQLVSRFINAADGDQSGVGLFKGINNLNKAAAIALNSIGLTIEFTSKLAIQAEECVKVQFEQTATSDSTEMALILESCKALENQTQKQFKELLKHSLVQLCDGFMKGGILSILQMYSSYDFISSEKTLQEFESFPSRWSIAFKFAKRVGECFAPWADSLRPEIFAELSRDFASLTATTVIGVVRKKKFNQLGALLLDKEVRQLLQCLEHESDQSLGKSFSKLNVLCEILVSDSREEARAAGLKAWEPKEIEEIIALRQDLV
jgi:hypothetical protein